MTLTDWTARWSHQVPPQALIELTAMLNPRQPLPAPVSCQSEAAGDAQIRLAAGQAGVPLR